MSDNNDVEKLKTNIEYWKPRIVWNENLKKIISESANRHVSTDNPPYYTCEIVQNEVMERLGFDLKPFLSKCGNARSGIINKIAALTELVVSAPDKVKSLSPIDAQDAANRSAGEYIVLSLMHDKLANGVDKHHVAIVIEGTFSPLNGPCIGGGGMTALQIARGWVLSNAKVHFSEWRRVKYFSYGYKKGETI